MWLVTATFESSELVYIGKWACCHGHVASKDGGTNRREGKIESLIPPLVHVKFELHTILNISLTL